MAEKWITVRSGKRYCAACGATEDLEEVIWKLKVLSIMIGYSLDKFSPDEDDALGLMSILSDIAKALTYPENEEGGAK